jgi:hypothetical protein
MRLAISFMHSRWVRVRPHRGTIEPSNHLQRRSLLAREYGRWRMETPKPGYPRKFAAITNTAVSRRRQRTMTAPSPSTSYRPAYSQAGSVALRQFRQTIFSAVSKHSSDPLRYGFRKLQVYGKLLSRRALVLPKPFRRLMQKCVTVNLLLALRRPISVLDRGW